MAGFTVSSVAGFPSLFSASVGSAVRSSVVALAAGGSSSVAVDGSVRSAAVSIC